MTTRRKESKRTPEEDKYYRERAFEEERELCTKWFHSLFLHFDPGNRSVETYAADFMSKVDLEYWLQVDPEYTPEKLDQCAAVIQEIARLFKQKPLTELNGQTEKAGVR